MATFWGIVSFLFMGALAGWLAGKLVQGKGFGLLANILIGVVGALLGGLLFTELGITLGDGFLWEFLQALAGALVLLLVAGVVRRLF